MPRKKCPFPGTIVQATMIFLEIRIYCLVEQKCAIRLIQRVICLLHFDVN